MSNFRGSLSNFAMVSPAHIKSVYDSLYFYDRILNQIHPVAILFHLRENAIHLERSKKILWVVDRVFEKQLRCKEPNEV